MLTAFGAAASIVLVSVPASATFTWGVVVRTPMVGIAAGQVARFNAVMSNPGPTQANPGPTQCDGTLTIVNGDGVALTSAARVALTPGQATFVDLRFDRAVAAGSDVSAPGAFRVMVRAIADFVCVSPGPNQAGVNPGPVQANPGPQQVQPGPISVSLEVFDASTGVAQVLVQPGPIQVQPGPTQVSPGPIGTPMFGIASGQTARLNAVMGQPGPTQCSADLTFVNGNGAPLATLQATLTPEHAVFFDFPFDATAAGDVNGTPRLTVRAVGTFVCSNPGPISRPLVSPGPISISPGPISISVEVFDAATGVAQVTINPGPSQ